MTRIHNLSSLRVLALYAQKLPTPNHQSKLDVDTIYGTVDQFGCIQIDTLQMVHRSLSLVLWSRLGSCSQPCNAYFHHKVRYNRKQSHPFSISRHSTVE